MHEMFQIYYNSEEEIKYTTLPGLKRQPDATALTSADISIKFLS